jgi:hypothetical protein
MVVSNIVMSSTLAPGDTKGVPPEVVECFLQVRNEVAALLILYDDVIDADL